MKNQIAALPTPLRTVVVAFLSFSLPAIAHAYYIYGDSSYCCVCETGRPCPEVYGTSLSEGNLSEQMPVARAGTAFGGAGPLRLSYNSYNADGSRAAIDTVMGFGWTHSYNVFLFSQRGHMFRYGGDGRVTLYKIGPGGTFTAAPGYFDTLVRNPDGSFTLRKKDGTTFKFAFVPGTPFLVGGPVYMLISRTDRNNNITSLGYTNGLLTTITDTYGRVLQLVYNALKKLVSVTDPLGRTFTLTYDPTGRQLLTVTDPLGHITRYSYNPVYQMADKIDTDGRRYFYDYGTGKPTGKTDGLGGAILGLSNPGNWAINETLSAPTLQRTYVPSTTTQTDGRGNQWKYDYDANGYVTRKVAPDGATTLYTYDPLTLMVASQTDANGRTTSYQYDARGNRTKITDALGNVSTFTYEPTFSMMTSMTEPKGRVTTYEYDARGNRTKETDALSQSRTWSYDSHGNVLTQTDKRGNTTTYTYDAGGNPATITAPAPLNYLTRMTYDAVGNLLTRTDPNGHITSYQYDGLNRLIRQTDPVGKSDRFEYDGQGNRTKVTDRNDHETKFQYDHRERPIKTTDALNQTSTMSYDGNNNRTSQTDRNGHTTNYEYDGQNRQTKATDAEFNITRFVYDPVGNVLTTIDANNHSTAYQYDALNRRVRTTNAESYVTIYQYDTGTSGGCTTCGATPGSSIITQQTDGNGKVTYFKYDKLDRLTNVVRKEGDTADVIDASDAVTSYNYDPDNNRLVATEPNGNAIAYEYDALNRLTRETNAAGDITRYTYDGDNNLITTIAPNGNVITNTYNTLERLTQVDDSIGRIVSYTYDPVGNRLSQTDGNNNPTDYSYDALNRLVATIDSLAHTTTTQYDPSGNVIKTTDREGRVTTYQYDSINRRIKTTDALPATAQYQYDGVGNLIKLTDPRGNATLYTYDAINRLTKEQHPDPAPNTRTFAYDAVNRISRTDQKGQTTTYAYNDLYFLVKRTYPVSPADNLTYDLSGRMLTAERGGWLVTYAYDGANRVLQSKQNGKTVAYLYNIPARIRSVTYPSGRLVTEQMDPRSRLSTIDDAASPPPIVQYTYDLGNRVGTRTYRNGTVATYTYNANDWVVSLEHKLGTTRIAGFGYNYDNEGNKAFEETRHDTSRSEAYRYDSLDRLIDYKVGALVGSTVPVPATQTAYNLDPVGNWNSKTIDAVVQNRVHNAANELTQIGAVSLLYDDNGNLQQDATYAYAYDEENRLIRVTRAADAAVVGQYQYDALGRRVQKIANPFGSPVTTRYFHDGARPIEEQDPTGATMATYVHGNYVDEVLSMVRASQTYYYHQNALWSVAAISDNAGSPVERYSYDAYGLSIVTTAAGAPIPQNPWGTPHSAIANPRLFTGRDLNEETGLYFHRARYYDCSKGRFLQRDPTGNGDGLNQYQYGRSRPTMLVDPYGLESEEPCVCGPDVTEFLKELIKSANDWHGPKGTLRGIKWLLENGQTLDWQISFFQTKNCPKGPRCEKTYWLCGECVHDHWIGNFMFGFLGRKLGISDIESDAGGNLVQGPGPGDPASSQYYDPPWDRAGYNLGRMSFFTLADGRLKADLSNLCELLKTGVKWWKGDWVKANDVSKGGTIVRNGGYLTNEVRYPTPSSSNYKDCKECPEKLPQKNVPGGSVGGKWPD